MKDIFLDIEIKLLIVKYGHSKVLSAISKIDTVDLSSVHDQLNRITKEQSKSSSKNGSSQMILEKIINSSKEPELTARIIDFYDKKYLFPNLNELNQFLIEHGRNIPVKTRKNSFIVLAEVLSKLDRHKLEQLANFAEANFQSGSFSKLANQIMDKGKT